MHIFHPTSGAGKSGLSPTIALPGETSPETPDSGAFLNLLGSELSADAQPETGLKGDVPDGLDVIALTSPDGKPGKPGKTDPQPGKTLPPALPAPVSSGSTSHLAINASEIFSPAAQVISDAGQAQPVATDKAAGVSVSAKPLGAETALKGEAALKTAPDTPPTATTVKTIPTDERAQVRGQGQAGTDSKPVTAKPLGAAIEHSANVPGSPRPAARHTAPGRQVSATTLPSLVQSDGGKPLNAIPSAPTGKAGRTAEPGGTRPATAAAITLSIKPKAQPASTHASQPAQHPAQAVFANTDGTPASTTPANPASAKPSTSGEVVPSDRPLVDAEQPAKQALRSRSATGNGSPTSTKTKIAHTAIAEPAIMPTVADARPASAAPAGAQVQPATNAVQTGPQDFTTLVDKLVEAREQASPHTIRTALRHTDFGLVNLQFRTNEARLNVTMASADPDFAPAVQAASIVAQAQAGASAENGQQHSASRQDGQNQQQQQIASGSGQTGAQTQSQSQSQSSAQSQAQSGQRDDPRDQQAQAQTDTGNGRQRPSPSGTDTPRGDIFA